MRGARREAGAGGYRWPVVGDGTSGEEAEREHVVTRQSVALSPLPDCSRTSAARVSAPTSGSPAAEQAPEPGAGGSSLFGRGLLYVLVYSLQTVISTVVSPVLAHVVGPAEFGRIAAAIALLQMLVVLNVLGLDQAVILQRAEDGDNRRARGLVLLSVVLAAVVSVVLTLTAPLWGPALGFGPLSPLLLATLVWTFAGGSTAVVLGLLTAEDRLRTLTVVSGIAGVGGPLVGVVLVWVLGPSATSYVYGMTACQLIALAIGLAAVRPRAGGVREWSTAARGFAIGMPIAVSGMAGFVLNAGDRIVIQRLLGPEQVGRYQVAYTVGYVVVLLLMFTSQAWSPRFAAVRDRTERLAMTERSRNDLYRLLMPMVLGITLAAPIILRVVAPASFDREPLLLVVFLIAIAAFPVAASGASGRELFTLRRGRSLAIAGVVAAVLNIGLNLVLVPMVGIAGAAVATAVALTLQAQLQLRAVPDRRSSWPRTPSTIWVGIVVTCVLALLTTLVPQSLGWNLGRLGVALVCLPWFLARLTAARTGQAPRWWSTLVRTGAKVSPAPR